MERLKLEGKSRLNGRPIIPAIHKILISGLFKNYLGENQKSSDIGRVHFF